MDLHNLVLTTFQSPVKQPINQATNKYLIKIYLLLD